jgi:hypothetical protein
MSKFKNHRQNVQKSGNKIHYPIERNINRTTMVNKANIFNEKLALKKENPSAKVEYLPLTVQQKR